MLRRTCNTHPILVRHQSSAQVCVCTREIVSRKQAKGSRGCPGVAAWAGSRVRRRNNKSKNKVQETRKHTGCSTVPVKLNTHAHTHREMYENMFAKTVMVAIPRWQILKWCFFLFILFYILKWVCIMYFKKTNLFHSDKNNQYNKYSF